MRPVKMFRSRFCTLVPISTAVWFVGRKVGLAFCVLSAAASLAMELTQEPLLAKAFWNTGIRFGVYLTFAALLGYAREHSVGSAFVFRVHRQVLIGLGMAGVLALGAGIVQRQMPASAVSLRPSAVRHVSAKSNSPLAELADLLDGSMRLSRPVLLGSRDPTGPSCVSVCRTGDVVDAAPPVNARFERRTGLDTGGDVRHRSRRIAIRRCWILSGIKGD